MAVTVIGDAFIDIVIPVGNIEPGRTYYKDISLSCGGTANVAVRISRLGEKARFLGKVGDDPFGRYFRDNLWRNGVQDLTFVDGGHPTGLCVSLAYPDGERSLIARRGANDYLSVQEITGHREEILNSTIVYFSGYSLLNNSSAITFAIEECRGKCEVWFNPGAPNVVDDSFGQMAHQLVDVLILNLDEARSMTKKHEIDEVLAILRGMSSLAVVTLGREGCLVAGEGGGILVPSPEPIEGVETTGAGDAFSAGFIAARLKGMDLGACARQAGRAAADFLGEKERIW